MAYIFSVRVVKSLYSAATDSASSLGLSSSLRKPLYCCCSSTDSSTRPLNPYCSTSFTFSLSSSSPTQPSGHHCVEHGQESFNFRPSLKIFRLFSIFVVIAHFSLLPNCANWRTEGRSSDAFLQRCLDFLQNYLKTHELQYEPSLVQFHESVSLPLWRVLSWAHCFGEALPHHVFSEMVHIAARSSLASPVTHESHLNVAVSFLHADKANRTDAFSVYPLFNVHLLSRSSALFRVQPLQRQQR